MSRVGDSPVPEPPGPQLEETAARALSDLEAEIGHAFADGALLASAVTHRSFVNEVDDPGIGHNERLEFLGDALLDFVAGDFLYRRLPEVREGEMTALRSLLVCESALAGFARAIDLGDYIRLGRGEAASGGRDRPAILCNTFEALIGALYLDAGLAEASEFALKFFEEETEQALDGRRIKDAKSLFQELAQRVWQTTPQYRTIAESGPDHDKRFRVAVLVGDEAWGVGEGRSKSVAARRAAQHALARYNGTEAVEHGPATRSQDEWPAPDGDADTVAVADGRVARHDETAGPDWD